MAQEIEQDVLVKRIKEKMADLRLNQAGLSSAAGITPAALSQILNKERIPSSGVLVKLAGALEESIDYLVGRMDKTDVSDLLQNPDVATFYESFSALQKSDKEQILNMMEFLKHKNKDA